MGLGINGAVKSILISGACYKCLVINIDLLIIVLDSNAYVSDPGCIKAKINMADAARGGVSVPPLQPVADFIAYS